MPCIIWQYICARRDPEAREGRKQPQYTDGGAGLGPSFSSSAALNCRDHRGDTCHAGALGSPAILVTKEDAHA